MSRWRFEVSRATHSRDAAWTRCVRSGLRVGIPAHARLKDHTATTWAYHTDTDERIAMRSRAVERRRETA